MLWEWNLSAIPRWLCPLLAAVVVGCHLAPPALAADVGKSPGYADPARTDARHADSKLRANKGNIVGNPYPASCFEDGTLPGFGSRVAETIFFEYPAVLFDAGNPLGFASQVEVRSWRAPCHTNGAAVLIELRALSGRPLAPAVFVEQDEAVAQARVVLEANTTVSDDTGREALLRANGTAVLVVDDSPEIRAAGVDFSQPFTLVIRDAQFDRTLEFPAYVPAEYGVGAFQSISGRHSGSWFSRVRDGEGFFVEVIERDDGSRSLFVSWYTYAGGNQMWLVGNVDIAAGARSAVVPLQRTTGTGFGQDFVAADVQREDWGSLTLRFRSCELLRVDYDGLDGAGAIELVRLTSIAGHACR